MKVNKLIALVLGSALCIGGLAGFGENNTAAIDKAELEQQIKANLDSYLDNY